MAVLSGIVGLAWAAFAACGGELVYPLDDSYIHMAIARNLWEHGTWGVTADAFSSTSSSPVWVILLAGLFGVFGSSDWVPLATNSVLAVAVVGVFSVWASRPRPPGGTPVSGAWSVPCVLAAVGLAPVPALAVQGMEHVLQLLTTVALVLGGARVLGARDGGGAGWLPVRSSALPPPPVGLAVLAAIAPLVRYEALFVVAVLVGLLVAQRRLFEGAIVGAAGVGPVAIYAAVAMSKGWYPLPTGVMLASSPAWTGVSVPDRLLANFTSPVALLPLAVLGLLCLRWFDRDPDRQAARVYVGTAALHLLFSRVGDAYRYDAYLVAIGVLVAAPAVLGGLHRLLGAGWSACDSGAGVPEALRGIRAQGAIALLSVALVTAPLVARSTFILSKSPAASADVQAFVMGPARLTVDVLRPSTVAISWLGYMAWLADGSLSFLDLDGLSSRDTANVFLQAGRGDDNTISRDLQLYRVIADHQVTAAVIGESWFQVRGFSGPPADWRLVASWMVTGQYGGWTLTHLLWATSDAELARLQGALHALLLRPGALAERAVLVLEEGRAVQPVRLTGAAVEQEPKRVAFYTTGEAGYVMPSDGELVVTLSGDEAGDGPAHLQVHGVAGDPVVPVGSRARRVELGAVHQGDVVTLTYTDDLVDADGRDRNVFVWAVRVVAR
ncbi:MAG: hypothetical protein EXR69_12135 [Myxococcales bacterium]|nr:hypothetical protein [Myxococcales bacterium]